MMRSFTWQIFIAIVKSVATVLSFSLLIESIPFDIFRIYEVMMWTLKRRRYSTSLVSSVAIRKTLRTSFVCSPTRPTGVL